MISNLIVSESYAFFQLLGVEVRFELQEQTVSEDVGVIEVCLLVLGTLERLLEFEVQIQEDSRSKLAITE